MRVISILVLVLASGCYPSASFVRSSVRTLDCRTGAFVGELVVQRQSARKVKVVYEVLPGSVNVEDVQHTPMRAVLKGKEGKEGTVQVEGRLVDRCASGGVNLLASYAPSGSTGFVEVEPVLPVTSPDQIGAADDGVFEYALTLKCCGPEGAGTFSLVAAESDATSNVHVEPASVECRGEQEHPVRVTGMLTGSDQGRVRLMVTDESTGAACEQVDAIRRGAPSSGAETPASPTPSI